MRTGLLLTSALGLGLIATGVAAQRDAGRDTLSEMQRERANPATPSVPLQNRDAAQADRLRNAEPAAWLRDAQDRLRRNRPGEANELLERAESRLLTRSTPADMAGRPAQLPAVRHIAEARNAVTQRNRTEALRHIDMAVAALGTPTATLRDGGSLPATVTRAVVLVQGSGGLSGSTPGSPGVGTGGSTPAERPSTTQQPPQGAASGLTPGSGGVGAGGSAGQVGAPPPGTPSSLPNVPQGSAPPPAVAPVR